MSKNYLEWVGLPLDTDMSEWLGVDHYEGDQIAAIAMLRGTEIHFAVNPEWRHRVIQRERTRAFLQPLLDRCGFLTTRSIGTGSHRFLKRMGFVETWAEGPVQHFMLCGVPFSRGEASCHS